MRTGLKVRLTLFDRSDVALAKARATAEEHQLSAETIQGNAASALPVGTFDVVTNSLFLHPLERDDAVQALAHMRSAARRMVVVSDLRRSIAGLAIAWTACRLLT